MILCHVPGTQRFRILKVLQQTPVVIAECEILTEPEEEDSAEVLSRLVQYLMCMLPRTATKCDALLLRMVLPSKATSCDPALDMRPY